MPQAKDNNFLHPGTRLGAERQYLILKPLGSGGFGKTYLARNTKFGDGGPQLVIKEFFMLREMHRDEHSSRALVSNPVNQATVNDFRAKFIREAQRIYQLSHPGIVRVTDVIYDENDTSYYVMDYVGGQSLNDLLEQRGVLPEAEAVDYVCQVLEALRVVHANRMLHLDVKPSNIMLNAQGRVVLIDFGASKIENFKGKISSTPMALSRGFASPEQISGSLKHIDPRADIYAVGATLYNLLTSNVVRDPMDLLQDKDVAFVFPLSVSEPVRRAVVRMMAYNSSDRPATVDEALALLRPTSVKHETPVEAPTLPKSGNWYTDMFEPPSGDALPADWLKNLKLPPQAEHGGKPVEELEEFHAKKKAPEPRGPNDIPDTKHVSKPFEKPKPKPQPKPQPVRSKKNKGNLALLLSALAGMVIVIGIMLGVRQCGGREATAADSYADSTADMSLQEMLEMVEVEGGTFTMGATSEQGSDAYDDEKPTHQVTLSTFSIGKYEVTQALWQEIMGSNPSDFKGDLLPVEQVSWDDCQEFLRKLNARKAEFGITDGRTFRLPTEAEWEYAARGGKLSKGFKYSGSNNIGDVAWCDENSGNKTHPVGTKQANELGIYDMSGNVWEWCQDWFGDYSSGAQTNPQGPASGSSRVFRGGSWYYFALGRVSNRRSLTPDIRFNFLGLRLVLKFP